MREHVAREAVHDEDLQGERVRGHEIGEDVDGLVDVTCVERSDARSGDALFAHGELRVEAEVNVRPTEEWQESGQLLLQRAATQLYVEKKQGAMASRPPINLLDERRVSALTELAVAPGRSLGDDGDQVQRGLHRRRGIGGRPRCDLAIEPRQHRVDRLRAEYAHTP